MGTPEFSVPALESLSKHHEVIAVYTQAPKPSGRGHFETPSPIHVLANNLKIPVFTPKTLRNADAISEFLSLEADVAVVVAYGLILPKEILNACKYGCINIHPSLLPFYRGAAPMQRTIMAGERETALCIMKMDEGVDTGDIFIMEKITLNEDMNYSYLSDHMSSLGAKLLLKTLEDIDIITPKKQEGVGSYASKIKKEEGELNWEEESKALMLKVLALNPWPGTFFYNNNEKIKVLEAKYNEESHCNNPGDVILKDQNILIACKKGYFQPTIVQKSGKKAMHIQEFLKGNKLNS